MGTHTLLIISFALILGVIGARLSKNIRFPQVVGYIIIGLIIGVSGFNLINAKLVKEFIPINYIALSIIGFLVGGELKKAVFKKYGKNFIVILLFEGLAAFLLVTLSIGFFSKDWNLAIILGALASATAPAATVDVLWEYKSAGPVTTTIYAIVALDDGLALILYGFANSIVKVSLSHTELSLFMSIGKPILEITISAIIGVISAYLFKLSLNLVRKYKHEKDLMLSFTFGLILLILAISKLLDVDLILSEMFFGLTFVNILPKRSKRIFEAIKDFSPPIYILFFILVGARLDIKNTSLITLLLALIYIVARSLGKIFGATYGAKITNSHKTVQKYLGLALFSQAGVTIGLALMAAQRFPVFGNTIIGIVTVTTLIVQIIGPPFVKYAIVKADETYKNISEEEVMEERKVKNYMDKKPTVFQVHTPLKKILPDVAESNYNCYPVLDKDKKIVGQISIENLKIMLNSLEAQDLFTAGDIMEDVQYIVSENENMKKAFGIMKRYAIQCIPVIDAKEKLLGIITMLQINKLMREIAIELNKKKNF